jgi:hypothetical protein
VTVAGIIDVAGRDVLSSACSTISSATTISSAASVATSRIGITAVAYGYRVRPGGTIYGFGTGPEPAAEKIRASDISAAVHQCCPEARGNAGLRTDKLVRLRIIDQETGHVRRVEAANLDDHNLVASGPANGPEGSHITGKQLGVLLLFHRGGGRQRAGVRKQPGAAFVLRGGSECDGREKQACECAFDESHNNFQLILFVYNG